MADVPRSAPFGPLNLSVQKLEQKKKKRATVPVSHIQFSFFSTLILGVESEKPTICYLCPLVGEAKVQFYQWDGKCLLQETQKVPEIKKVHTSKVSEPRGIQEPTTRTRGHNEKDR